IPRGDFLRLMERVQPEVRRLATIPAIGQPTEFEVKTLLGFLHFAEREVDLSVLEVGLGGRLDATNVVTPTVSAITSIGLDHVDRLGGSLESIAWEKAGIIKPGVPCVVAAEGPALRVIEGVAREREAPLLRVGNEVLWEGSNGCLHVSVEGRAYGPFTLGLRGPFQRSNAAVAVAMAHLLRQQGWSLPDRALAQGLSDAYQPARMEVIQREPTVLLDGAHNLPAALALREALAEGFPRRRLILVLGMLRGHNAEDVLRQLEPLADRIILTAADAPRAADPEDLRQLLSRPDKADVILPVRSAYERALEIADPEDLVLVTGSFYLMTEIPRAAAVCSIPASAAYAS
ncbi:MAG TPA: cyanophycin synthetase, partial [Armatimonadota bacterium]